MKRNQSGNRMFLGIYLWQWAVGIGLLIGLNLMFTVPPALNAYEQQQTQSHSYWKCEPR
jgi:hypothetical protein